jgi:hypothetical protein
MSPRLPIPINRTLMLEAAALLAFAVLVGILQALNPPQKAAAVAMYHGDL